MTKYIKNMPKHPQLKNKIAVQKATLTYFTINKLSVLSLILKKKLGNFAYNH